MENRDEQTRTGRSALASAGMAEKSAAPLVDWAAVLGGAVLVAALGTLFAGFGAGLGLTAVSAEEGEGSGTLAMVLATVWIVLSTIAAYAIGGYVAGRMRRRAEGAPTDEVEVRDGINGLIVWALGTVLSAMLLAQAATGVISAAGSAAATGAEVAGAAVGSAAGGTLAAASELVPENPAEFITGTLLRPTTVDPATAGSGDVTADAASIMANVVRTGEISDADRAYLVQLAAARTGAAPADVEARVDQAVTAAQTARDEAARLAAEAEQTARDVAETARISAILTAFLLTATALVAAVAAYVCAVRGGHDRDQGRVFAGLSHRGRSAP